MKIKISASACIIVCALWCAAEAGPANTTAGVISGTVSGSDGTKITSGRVSASGTPDTVRSRTSVSATIQSDGSFVLSGLATGRYQICVQAKDTWLDPCEWGPGGLAVTLSSSQPAANVSIVLNKGALVLVRVNDPGQLLSANEGKTTGAHLLLGVATDALFFKNANVVSRDTGGRTHQILIPFGRTVNVSIASALFQLTDVTGKTLPKASVIPVLVPSGQQAPTVLLNITGLATQ